MTCFNACLDVYKRQTLSNIWHTLQGWSDTPLTEKGIAQGKALGRGLANTPFEKIYSSTSERAYDTACYIRGKRNMEITMCRGLKEMNFGTFETKANTFAGCETYLQRIQFPWKAAGGENLEDVCQRIHQTMRQILLSLIHIFHGASLRFNFYGNAGRIGKCRIH